MNPFESRKKPESISPDSAEANRKRFWRKSSGKKPAFNLNEPKLIVPKIGSVPYLNAAPLTYGLEDEAVMTVPSKLAELIRAGELDAALVSVTEVLFHSGYDVLDGIAVASRGAVKSVFLAHLKPMEEIDVIWCDTASLTSVNLLRVLLAERGLKPLFKPLPSYEAADDYPAVLLIGDPALRFAHGNYPHAIWDLGLAWHNLTKLPFVYAVWALRRGAHNESLRNKLRNAKKLGLAQMDELISIRREFTPELRRAYLTGHIRYDLGETEKRGLARFVDLLRLHAQGPVYAPRYVN